MTVRTGSLDQRSTARRGSEAREGFSVEGGQAVVKLAGPVDDVLGRSMLPSTMLAHAEVPQTKMTRWGRPVYQRETPRSSGCLQCRSCLPWEMLQ